MLRIFITQRKASLYSPPHITSKEAIAVKVVANIVLTATTKKRVDSKSHLKPPVLYSSEWR